MPTPPRRSTPRLLPEKCSTWTTRQCAESVANRGMPSEKSDQTTSRKLSRRPPRIPHPPYRAWLSQPGEESSSTQRPFARAAGAGLFRCVRETRQAPAHIRSGAGPESRPTPRRDLAARAPDQAPARTSHRSRCRRLRRTRTCCQGGGQRLRLARPSRTPSTAAREEALPTAEATMPRPSVERERAATSEDWPDQSRWDYATGRETAETVRRRPSQLQQQLASFAR